MATFGAGGALPRVSMRVVRVAELLILAVGFYYLPFLDLPCATAAASSVLRVAASFAVKTHFFVVANVLVMFLFAVYRRDPDCHSFSAGGFLSWWLSDGDAQDPYLPLPGPPLMLPPPITEAGEEEAVFEDKEAVHVTTVRAQPPRRTKSEKTAGGGAAGQRAAAAPELRRGQSENGRQHLLAAPEVSPECAMDDEAFLSPVEWGMDDETFWAFILKHKTLFRREEFDAAAAAAKAARDHAAVTAGAVVAVK